MTIRDINPLWPAGRPLGVVHGHVAHGLKPESGAKLGVVAEADVDGGTLTVEFIAGGTVQLIVARPARLARALARADLTRVRGRPLVLVNPRAGVLGVAHRPPEPPTRLQVLFISRLEDGEAVAVPGADGNPSWALLAVA